METAARDLGPEPGRRRFHLVELSDRREACDEVIADLETESGLVRRVALRVTADGTRDAARVRAGRDRIYRQASVLGRLAHRNIAAAEDVVRVDGRWAIVGEAIVGADLDRVCAALDAHGTAFPAPAAFEVGAAVASALDAAWSSIDDTGIPLGLLHRNLQPSAIRITADGGVKVTEFCVHPGPADPEGRTEPGGNELYQAPERLVGTADLSASDVYSAAAIVLELVLGRPFGRTPVLPDPHTAVVNGALSAARARLRGPPEVVDDALDLLRRALSSKIDQRPSAADFGLSCDVIARRLAGERLEPFARRFVLQVDPILGRTPSPLSGTWLEHGSDDLQVSFARAPNPAAPP
ncbi:MAG: protein kinase, partial [Myxococcota bacterium]